MRKPLTVLQVVPSLEAGGAERATVDIAAALFKEGHRAFVISSGGRMVKELEEKGGRHYVFPVHSKNPLIMLNNARVLMGFIKKHGVDIIHARSRAPAWSAYLAANAMRVPFVTTFHAAYKGNTAPWKKIYNSVMAGSDRIIAISNFIADHIKKDYGVKDEKIAIIHRGIDFSVYDRAAISDERKLAFLKAAEAKPGVPLIILPGRLSPIKGQELALRAAAKVKLGFHLVVVGPDQGREGYSQSLRDLTQDLGLASKVTFLPSADLPAGYAVSDLVLSPSQVPEGFGRVPVEAQAMRVPVIATALGATSETVQNGKTGWLVPEGNVEALASVIEHALALPAAQREAMGEAGQAYVREHFDMKDMCASTLRVYDELWRKGRS